MKSKQEVLNWFGDRGVSLAVTSLKFWSCANGALYYIVKADSDEIDSTEAGYVDLTYTHRDNGSVIRCYELYDSITISDYETLAAADAVLTPIPDRFKHASQTDKVDLGCNENAGPYLGRLRG